MPREGPYDFSVLRVAAFPTEKRNGMGLPAYMLAADTRYSTVYRAPAVRREPPLEAPGEQVDLRLFPFPTRPLPQEWRISPGMVDALMRRAATAAIFNTRVLLDGAARKVDLVHIHSPMYVGVAAYAKLRGIPTVLTFHGTDFFRVQGSSLLRRFLAPIDQILCVSDLFVSELKRLLPKKKIDPVYNGVDSDRFSPSLAPPEGRLSRIIAVGNLSWYKDHRRLIAAFAELAETYPEWELAIAGEGELRSELEQVASDAGLSKRVRFMGTLSHEELAKEVAASEVFAMSSVTEGLPKALLEAMASGCACVATDVGECRSVLGDAGLIAPPEDTPSIASALDSLLSSAELRRKLGQRAVERARTYTWQAYRDRHLRIYQNLLGY